MASALFDSLLASRGGLQPPKIAETARLTTIELLSDVR